MASRLLTIAGVWRDAGPAAVDAPLEVYISPQILEEMGCSLGDVALLACDGRRCPAVIKWTPVRPIEDVPSPSGADSSGNVYISTMTSRNLFGSEDLADVVGRPVEFVGSPQPPLRLPVPEDVSIQEIVHPCSSVPFLGHSFGSVDSLSILCGPDPDAELSQSIISTLMYGSLLLEGITICVSWFNRPMHLRVVSVSSGSASLCRSGASTRVRVCPPPPPSLSPHWRERSLAECPGAEDTVERLVDALSITSEGFTGVLLSGQKGCGKTHIAHSVARHTGLVVHALNAADVVKGVSGAGLAHAETFWGVVAATAPCVVLLDDCELLAPVEPATPFQRRMLVSLMHSIDVLKASKSRVLLIATAASSAMVHPSILTPNRITSSVEMQVPITSQRLNLLHWLHARQDTLDFEKTDLEWLAAMTAGYVAADLCDLWRECCLLAVAAGATLSREVLASALAVVQPRNQFGTAMGTIPLDATLDGLKGIDVCIATIRAALSMALSSTESFAASGLTPPRGVLLHGPGGVGKTSLAHAFANSLKGTVSAVSVRCPDLISPLVGDTEAAIANLFRTARANSPALIIFDQIDALAPRRVSESSSHVMDRLLSVLLVEMDGISSDMASSPVFIIATTSHKNILDPAILRPGRLDQHVEIPLPSLDSRRAIAKYYLSKLSLVDTDDYFSTFPALFGLTSPPQQPALPAFADRVAMMCDGCSSAVIEDVCREAGMAALRRDLAEGVVRWSDIADSLPTARVPKPRV